MFVFERIAKNSAVPSHARSPHTFKDTPDTPANNVHLGRGLRYATIVPPLIASNISALKWPVLRRLVPLCFIRCNSRAGVHRSRDYACCIYHRKVSLSVRIMHSIRLLAPDIDDTCMILELSSGQKTSGNDASMFVYEHRLTLVQCCLSWGLLSTEHAL